MKSLQPTESLGWRKEKAKGSRCGYEFGLCDVNGVSSAIPFTEVGLHRSVYVLATSAGVTRDVDAGVFFFLHVPFCQESRASVPISLAEPKVEFRVCTHGHFALNSVRHHTRKKIPDRRHLTDIRLHVQTQNRHRLGVLVMFIVGHFSMKNNLSSSLYCRSRTSRYNHITFPNSKRDQVSDASKDPPPLTAQLGKILQQCA